MIETTLIETAIEATIEATIEARVETLYGTDDGPIDDQRMLTNISLWQVTGPFKLISKKIRQPSIAKLPCKQGKPLYT